MAHDEAADLAAQVQAMQWEHVALAPDPAEVEALDKEMPQEWLTELEQQETELDPFADLYEMSDQELQAEVGESIEALGIDVDALIDEIKGPEIELDLAPPDHDFDFGR